MGFSGFFGDFRGFLRFFKENEGFLMGFWGFFTAEALPVFVFDYAEVFAAFEN